jgi:uncharacterized membrane protein YhaH (DUF805 family)/ABC-type dipeptide/oligopeptide/nickel transport system permease component/ABC-type dipeptide/oligopeptide/nickel transport system permease subunit
MMSVVDAPREFVSEQRGRSAMSLQLGRGNQLSFTQAISSGFNKYADFGSRSSRSEYWYWALFSFVAALTAMIVDAFTTGFLLYSIFALGTFIPSLAVAVRRLHDVDRSGWWMFISAVPIFGSIILLVWLIGEGTPGDNRFGGDPAPRSPQPCHECGTENPYGSASCSNCGTTLHDSPDYTESVVPMSTRFLTPAVGLIVGLIFAIVLLQTTRLGPEAYVDQGGYGITEQQWEDLKEKFSGEPPIIFWPVSGSMNSKFSQRPVTELLWGRFSTTFELLILSGGLALLIIWGLGLVLGRGHPSTIAARLPLASLGTIPVFWLGLVMIWLFAVQLDLLPAGGHIPFSESPSENLRRLFMPILSLGLLGGLAIGMEMRSRENESSAIVLARAVGLLFRHGGLLLTGIILVETIFALPGVGRLILDATWSFDGPMLGATAALFIWMGLWSRLIGNAILAAVGNAPPPRNVTPESNRGAQSLVIASVITVVLLVILFLAPFAAPEDPNVTNLRDRNSGPSGEFLFGADHIGRDVFSRTLHAGRTLAATAVPLALLALAVGIPMAFARGMIERAQSWTAIHVVDGVLDGLVAVPWLIIGVLIYVATGPGWPFVALAAILVPRALQAGWNLGAGQDFRGVQAGLAVVHIGTLFLAAAAAMSIVLGFMGVGVPPPTPEFGGQIAESRGYIVANAPTMFIPGILVTLIIATWLAMATLTARSGNEYRPAGWGQTMS